MSNVFIPKPGDQLQLTRDWAFKLHQEYRNSDLTRALGLQFKEKPYVVGQPYVRPDPLDVTLPAGTVLKIDRIYIRSNRDYDSVTFRTVYSPEDSICPKKAGGKGVSCRFWAKLADVNTIDGEWMLP